MKDYNTLGIDFSQYSVLIVDDIAVNIILVEKMLKPYPFNILKATSGQEALNVIASSHPNIVLLDIMMPGMDGFEVTRRVREQTDIPYIPIIIMSALNSETDVTKGFSLGADGYIPKPIVRENLLTTVMTHISQEEAQRLIEELDARSGTAELNQVRTLGNYMFCTSPARTALLADAAACLPAAWFDDSFFAAIQGTDDNTLQNTLTIWTMRNIHGKNGEAQATDIAALIDDTLKTLAPAAGERALSWQPEKTGDLTVTRDADLCRCIVNGLLASACRMSRNSTIELRAARENDKITLALQGSLEAGAEAGAAFPLSLVHEAAMKLGGSLTTEYSAGAFRLVCTL